jgi:sugar lactone lactonase YvrE
MSESVLLRRRDVRERTIGGPQEICEAAEREIEVGFAAGGSKGRPCSGPSLDRIVEKGRLPDPGLAGDEQDAAVSAECSLDEAVDELPFSLPSEEHGSKPREIPGAMWRATSYSRPRDRAADAGRSMSGEQGGIVNGARGGLALAALVVGAVCAVGATAATGGQGYKVVGKIGKLGTGNGQFTQQLSGMATDKAGNLYVADGNNRRIQEFSATGAYKAKWQFERGLSVVDVAVGPTGDVWGTTQVNAQVRRFPAKGGAPENLSTPKSAEGIAVDADGNVYVGTTGDNIQEVVRFDKTPTGWSEAKTWARGFQWPGDVEVSPDGSIYVGDRRGSPPLIRRYDASGNLLGTIKTGHPATGGAGDPYNFGVDPDCNLWVTNGAQRRIDKLSPSGKLLGSTTSGDLVATDVAVGPKGDLYVGDINTASVIHFAEDRSKPGTANVPAKIAVKKGKATVRYTATGFACPAQVDASFTLKGAGVSGAGKAKVAVGKANSLAMTVKGPAGKTAKATFTIVLRTNGRPTTEKKSVQVSFAK